VPGRTASAPPHDTGIATNNATAMTATTSDREREGIT